MDDKWEEQQPLYDGRMHRQEAAAQVHTKPLHWQLVGQKEAIELDTSDHFMQKRAGVIVSHY